MFSRALPLTYLGAPRLLNVRRGGIAGALSTRCPVVFTGILKGPDLDVYLN